MFSRIHVYVTCTSPLLACQHRRPHAPSQRTRCILYVAPTHRQVRLRRTYLNDCGVGELQDAATGVLQTNPGARRACHRNSLMARSGCCRE